MLVKTNSHEKKAILFALAVGGVFTFQASAQGPSLALNTKSDHTAVGLRAG
jgi:hypothetical protein